MTAGPRQDPLAEKMRLALAGDDSAYREVLEQLAVMLRRLVWARLSKAGKGNSEVEDIVQDVLLTIHLKRHTWDQSLPFLPWAHAVARHKLIDSLRKQGSRQFVPLDDFTELLEAPADSQQDLGDAEKLIAMLSPHQQRIVRGVAIDGHSHAEMGRELNMQEGAVRVALHRALKELARLYRGHNK